MTTHQPSRQAIDLLTATLGTLPVIADQGEDEQHWLDTRKHFVTGTGVAAAMGLSKWMKPGEVAKFAAMDAPPPFPVNRFMRWGSLMEVANGEVAADVLRAAVLPANVLVRAPGDIPVASSLDALITYDDSFPEDLVETLLCSTEQDDICRAFLQDHEGEVGLLELKNVGQWGAKTWKVGPPDHYLMQVHVQLMCTGLPWAIICAKVGAADMFMHVIEADRMEFDRIEDSVSEFLDDYDLRSYIDGKAPARPESTTK